MVTPRLDPVLHLERLAARSGVGVHLQDTSPVIGVNSGNENFIGAAEGHLIDVENPIKLFGPPDRIAGNVISPTAHSCRPLRLCQVEFTLSQRFIHLPALGDVLADAGDPVHLPGPIFDGKSAVADPAQGSVGSHDTVFNVESRFPSRFNALDRGRAVVIMDRVKKRPRLSTHTCRRSAPDFFIGGTYVENLVHGAIAHPEDVLDVFGNLAEAQFALSQRLCCAPLRGAQRHNEKAHQRRQQQARYLLVHTQRIDGDEEVIMESKEAERQRKQARLDTSQQGAEHDGAKKWG